MITSISNNFNIHKLGLKKDKEKNIYTTSPIKSDSFSQVSFSGKCQYCASIMVPKAASKKLVNKLLHTSGEELVLEVQKFSEGFIGRFSKLKKEKRKRYIAQYVFWDSVEKMAKFEPKSSLKKILKDNFEVIDNFESYLEFQLKPFFKSNDHIAAESRGGRLFEANTGHVCDACNKIKGNKKFQNFFMVFPEIRKNMPASKFKSAMEAKSPSEIKKSMEKMAQESVLKSSPKKEPLKEELIASIDKYNKDATELDNQIKELETELKTLKKVEEYFSGLTKHLGKQKYIKAHAQKRKLKKTIKELGKTIKEHAENDYQALLKRHLQEKPKMEINVNKADYKAYQNQLSSWNKQKEALQEELKIAQNKVYKTRKDKNIAEKNALRKLSEHQAQRPEFNPEEINAIKEYNKNIKEWVSKKGSLERKIEISKSLNKLKEEQTLTRHKLNQKALAFPSLKKLNFKIRFIDELLNAKNDIPKKLNSMNNKFRKETSVEAIEIQLKNLAQELEVATAKKTLAKQLELESAINLLKKKKNVLIKPYKEKIAQKEKEIEILKQKLDTQLPEQNTIDFSQKSISSKELKTFRQSIKYNFHLEQKVDEHQSSINKFEVQLEDLLKQEKSLDPKEKTFKIEKQKIEKKKITLKNKIDEDKKQINTYEKLKKKTPEAVKNNLTPTEIENYQNKIIQRLTDNTKKIESKISQLEFENKALIEEAQSKIYSFNTNIKKAQEELKELPEVPEIIGGTLKKDLKERLALIQRREKLNTHLNTINSKIDALKKANLDTSKLEKSKQLVNNHLEEISPHFKKEDKVSNIHNELSSLNKEISTAKKQKLKTEKLEENYAKKYEELEEIKAQLPKETTARSIEKIEEEMEYLNSLIEQSLNGESFNLRLLDKIINLEKLEQRLQKLDEPIYDKALVEQKQLTILLSHFNLSRRTVATLDSFLARKTRLKLKASSLRKIVEKPTNLPSSVTKELKLADNSHVLDEIKLKVLIDYLKLSPTCITSLDSKLPLSIQKKTDAQTLREFITNSIDTLPKQVKTNLEINTARDYLKFRKHQLLRRKQEIVDIFDSIKQAKLGSIQVKQEKSELFGQLSSLKNEKGHIGAKVHQLEENLKAFEKN